MIQPFLSFPRRRSGGVETLIPIGTGTVIGDMVSGGGNAKAFDSNVSSADVASNNAARKNSASSGYVGKDWGSGVTKTITRAIVYGSRDHGFTDSSSGTYSVTLRGSNDGSSWTTLGSASGLTDVAFDASRVFASIPKTDLSGGAVNTSTAYRYHSFLITYSGEIYVGEVEFYETI